MTESKNLNLARYYDQHSDGPKAALFYYKALESDELFETDDLFNAAVIFILLDDLRYDSLGIVPVEIKAICYELANVFLEKIESNNACDLLDVVFWKDYIKLLSGDVDSIIIPDDYFSSGAISGAIYLENGILNSDVDVNSILSKAKELNSERGRYIFSILSKYI